MKSIIIAIIVVCLIIYIGGKIRDSIPMGYEDENGFHYGVDPRNKS